MTDRGTVLDDGTLRLEYLATADETAGALHEMRATYAPASPFPPAHHHPRQQERFVVERGRLVFDVDGHERTVAAGEEIVVPPGAVHRVRNDATEPAVALWQTRPALRTGEFLVAVSRAREGRDPLGLAAVVHEFGDVYRLAAGPRRVTGPAVAALAHLARLRDRVRGRRRRGVA